MKSKTNILRKHWQPDVLRKPFDYAVYLDRKKASDNKYKNSTGIIIPMMYPDSFDWSRWRIGMVIWRELGIASRNVDILEQKDVLRIFAIGYLPGQKLICRPKIDETAVMFLIDDEFCWTHLRQKEFDDVFIK
jgi:hypothetical protein